MTRLPEPDQGHRTRTNRRHTERHEPWMQEISPGRYVVRNIWIDPLTGKYILNPEPETDADPQDTP